MGAYPTWPWLVILVVDLVCVAVPILAVRPDSQLTRMAFATRLCLMLIAVKALNFFFIDLPLVYEANPIVLQEFIPPTDHKMYLYVGSFSVQPGEITVDLSLRGVLLTAETLAMFCAVVWWSVSRAQDGGWSKWLCLLWAVPILNSLFFLVLFLRPSASVLEAFLAESRHRPAS